MSSPIWTPGALSSEAVGIDGKYWRMVEAQHHVSTLKIVDTLDEQALLEDLIEETKPRIPQECRHLHYLLATPFRYGSVYPHGSRFRRAGRTKGVYYAAETMMTAVAEMAFHRLLFFAESPATPWPSDAAEYTAFAAAIKCASAIDLTRPPLDRDAAAWMHPTDYAACQAIADAAREAGLEAIRYRSARDPKGANIALLTCRGFTKAKPLEPRTWRIRLGAFGVQAICEFPEKRIEFSRTAFADPRLASLRWERGR
ncbi:RES family NAD+ phosphorylase [Mesorhizobium sp. AR07]|uniref:RES family NAD+ phosphorylase n=1 Tax=Mesorhizobium sp. AR07 TaxID=2865838 RepID=UPI00215EB143|nr:RES family NAD+ phosphorylase [Mesorhizobium sp. AR07]UVK45586.1 RES family NAD+ phosphorylase [Mesorhizobium sp. AR07]